MQSDNNLVGYDASGSVFWASHTNGKGIKPAKLEFTCDYKL